MPDNQDLRNSILAFLAVNDGPEYSLDLLPSGIRTPLQTDFWQSQARAEDLWNQGEREGAFNEFRAALDNLTPEEHRIVGSTAFNSGNEDNGIHEMLYRWARRLLSERQYESAVSLMNTAIERWIFAPIPTSPH